MEYPVDVFICHSEKDSLVAEEICKYFERSGLQCWISSRNIRSGYSYDDEINEAVRSCKALVFICSRHSVLSLNVINEIKIAYNEDKIILPFKIDDVSVAGSLIQFLENKPWILAMHNYPIYLDSLFTYYRILSNSTNKSHIISENTDELSISKKAFKYDISGNSTISDSIDEWDSVFDGMGVPMNRIEEINSRLKNLEDQIKYFETKIKEEELTIDQSFELSEAYLDLAFIKHKLRHWESMEDNLAKAIQIIEPWQKKLPKDIRLDFHFNFVSLNRGYALYKAGDKDKGQELLSAGVIEFENLLPKFLNDIEFLVVLTDAYLKMANIFKSQNEFDFALDQLFKALKVREKLELLKPQEIKISNYLALTHFYIGSLFEKKKNLMEALRYFHKSKDILVKMLEKHPESFLLNNNLIRLNSRINSIDGNHSFSYHLPHILLLKEFNNPKYTLSDDELIRKKNVIVNILQKMNIKVKKIRATIGAGFTSYEVIPPPDISATDFRKKSMKNGSKFYDLSPRIVTNEIGSKSFRIEVPHDRPEQVDFWPLVGKIKDRGKNQNLQLLLGRNIDNKAFLSDLSNMPHLLICGDSPEAISEAERVCLASLLFNKTPSQLKLLFIDPTFEKYKLFAPLEKHYIPQVKGIENFIYSDEKDIIEVLRFLVFESQRRYQILCRQSDQQLVAGYNREDMPFIVVFINEYESIMMKAGDHFSMPLAHISLVARQVGIHIIMTNSEPSSDSLTPLIWANFHARAVFRISSAKNSFAVMDSDDALYLQGNRDMLYFNGYESTRVQLPCIDEEDMVSILKYVESQPLLV